MSKLRPKETLEQKLEFLFHQLLEQKDLFNKGQYYEKHERQNILANWFCASLNVIVKQRHANQESDKPDNFISALVQQKANPYFKKIMNNKIQIENAARKLAQKIFDIFVSYEEKEKA